VTDATEPGRAPATDAGGPPGLDLVRLRRHLAAVLDHPPRAALQASVIAGGRSNVTYRVSDGRSVWVVRRPPLGGVLATAHDVGREARVMSALAGTAVPVPPVLHLCEDSGVIGAPFVVMRFVDGVVLRGPEQMADYGPDDLARAGDLLVDTLLALHAVDPDEVGLSRFGKPEGFLLRNVRRWATQWESSRTRDLPVVDEIARRLEGDVPRTQRVAVVHGDYRLDNVMFAPDLSSVAAVVDWELSTLGDPLADVGLLLTYTEVASAVLGLGTAQGLPAAPDVLARYAAGSDLDLAAIAWYTAFGVFKLAVILEGVHARYRAGATVGEGFETMGGFVPVLAARAAELLEV
jgi:aminoglycoside phosphotransferase (APT) family kinase protein